MGRRADQLGGEAKGAGDLAAAVRTAVINKRAGGMGLISGRKAFQKPMAEASRCSTRSRTSTCRRRHDRVAARRLRIALRLQTIT